MPRAVRKPEELGLAEMVVKIDEASPCGTPFCSAIASSGSEYVST